MSEPVRLTVDQWRALEWLALQPHSYHVMPTIRLSEAAVSLLGLGLVCVLFGEERRFCIDITGRRILEGLPIHGEK